MTLQTFYLFYKVEAESAPSAVFRFFFVGVSCVRTPLPDTNVGFGVTERR